MNPEASEIIMYQTEDGRTRIQCRFDGETLWLTQAQIAELFGTTPQNITLHLRAIYGEGELLEAATCKDYLQVRGDGSIFRLRGAGWGGVLAAQTFLSGFTFLRRGTVAGWRRDQL
jgi:hypothetical protein